MIEIDCIFCEYMDVELIIYLIPCGLINSNHPWSIVFNIEWAVGEVNERIFCVDNGVKNHIIALACKGIIICCWSEFLFSVSFKISSILKIVRIKGDHFRIKGRNGSGEGLNINQLIQAPPMIAPVAKNSIGVVVLISSSEVNCGGSLILGEVKAVIVRRIEYAAVNPVAIENIIIIIGFAGLNKDISIIRSFEKKPAMNGNPHNAKLAVRRADIVKGIWLDKFPTVRRSWEWWWIWIKVPAHTNRRALKRAWVTKWNNANIGSPKAILLIITPNCLKVESAIIFLRSDSAIAFIPAINIVRVAIIRRDEWNKFSFESEG